MDKKYKKYKQPNIFRRLFTFSGEMSVSEFWSELGIWLVEFVCAAVILCILVSVLVPGDTEYLISVVNSAIPFLAVLWAIRVIAMTRRRLRYAGFSAKSYLWLLVPVIGAVVFLVLLCMKQAPQKKHTSN